MTGLGCRLGMVAGLALIGGASASIQAQAGVVIVQGKLDGDILGYDIDQNGKEGVLTESLALNDGKYDVAVELFSQKTGKILKIVREIKETMSDFDAYPIVGKDVGLVLYQKQQLSGGYKNTIKVLNPLNNGSFTGTWTPKFAGDLLQISEDQGQSETAVLGGSFTAHSFVFESDVAQNTFSSKVKLADSVFDSGDGPVMAFDSATNTAVVASSLGCGTCGTEIGLADLSNGTFSEFAGLGVGAVSGIAVDSDDGIACTTTTIDDNVQFYDLAKQTGFEVPMPSGTNGTDVEYDPVNKLFLIEQSYADAASGSSMQVFDTSGNLKESIPVQRLTGSRALIAVNPNTRTAFVPLVTGVEVKQLQSFNY